MSDHDHLSFTVPLTPPSVNHYKSLNRKTGRWYVTRAGKAYKAAVAIFAAGRKVVARRYRLDATVFLGKRQRLDGDNGWKCIGDGLKEAGVIHSDAAVKKWHIDVDRDWANPRTEITVTAMAVRSKKGA